MIATTTPLGANATFTSGVLVVSGLDNIVGTVFADAAGTIYVEQSFDRANWDISTDYAVAANDGKGFAEKVYAPFVRLRYVNGSSAQSAFRLYGRLGSGNDTLI